MANRRIAIGSHLAFSRSLVSKGCANSPNQLFKLLILLWFGLFHGRERGAFGAGFLFNHQGIPARFEGDRAFIRRPSNRCPVLGAGWREEPIRATVRDRRGADKRYAAML